MLTTVDEGYTTDDYGPCEEEQVSRPHVHNGIVRTEILEYIVTMPRNNDLCVTNM